MHISPPRMERKMPKNVLAIFGHRAHSGHFNILVLKLELEYSGVGIAFPDENINIYVLINSSTNLWGLGRFLSSLDPILVVLHVLEIPRILFVA